MCIKIRAQKKYVHANPGNKGSLQKHHSLSLSLALSRYRDRNSAPKPPKTSRPEFQLPLTPWRCVNVGIWTPHGFGVPFGCPLNLKEHPPKNDTPTYTLSWVIEPTRERAFSLCLRLTDRSYLMGTPFLKFQQLRAQASLGRQLRTTSHFT